LIFLDWFAGARSEDRLGLVKEPIAVNYYPVHTFLSAYILWVYGSRFWGLRVVGLGMEVIGRKQ
jgi:hypothetical protein